MKTAIFFVFLIIFILFILGIFGYAGIYANSEEIGLNNNNYGKDNLVNCNV